MKNTIIIVAVLAIITIVHGANVERLKMFYQNIGICQQELGVTIAESPEAHANIVTCAVDKDGKILDENGEYRLKETMEALEDAISDSAKVASAKEIFTKCYEEGNQGGGSSSEKRKRISMCALPSVALFDKM